MRVATVDEFKDLMLKIMNTAQGDRLNRVRKHTRSPETAIQHLVKSTWVDVLTENVPKDLLVSVMFLEEAVDKVDTLAGAVWDRVRKFGSRRR